MRSSSRVITAAHVRRLHYPKQVEIVNHRIESDFTFKLTTTCGGSMQDAASCSSLPDAAACHVQHLVVTRVNHV